MEQDATASIEAHLRTRPSLKQALIQAQIDALPGGEQFQLWRFPFNERIFGIGDFEWLIQASQGATDPRTKHAWFQIAFSLWAQAGFSPSNYFDRLEQTAAQCSSCLEFWDAWRVQSLDSDLARLQADRAEYRKKQVDDEEKTKEAFVRAIPEIRAGNMHWMVRVSDQLHHRSVDYFGFPDVAKLIDNFGFDLAAAAREGYLRIWAAPSVQASYWNPAENSIPWPVIVLGHALELAIKEPCFSFAAITPPQVEAAALIALRYANSLPTWLEPLYRAHTNELQTYLSTLVSAEANLKTGHARLTGSLPNADILKEEFIQLAHRFLLNQTIPTNVAVLEALLELAIRQPRSIFNSFIAVAAQSHLKGIGSPDEHQRRRPMLLLAAWWILDWKPAWTIATKNVFRGTQGKERLLEFVGALRRLHSASAFRDNWPATISNEATVALLPRVYRAFPPGRGDHVLGVHAVTPSEELRRLRDAMVKRIADNDPALATRTLNQWMIKKEFRPHRTWFMHILSDIEKRLTDESWTTPSPQELTEALFRDHALIRCLEDMVNFLAGVLDQDVRKDLYGDASLIPQLIWRGTKKTDRTPTGEKMLQQLLASVIKPLLKSRQIVFAREPELLDAKKPEMRFSLALPNGQQLHVPCEVKRAHARDLWSAPANQLVTRYMREPGVRYGFYLIGWYGIRTQPDPVHRKKYADPGDLQSALQRHVDDTLDSHGKKIIAVVYDLTL